MFIDVKNKPHSAFHCRKQDTHFFVLFTNHRSPTCHYPSLDPIISPDRWQSIHLGALPVIAKQRHP